MKRIAKKLTPLASLTLITLLSIGGIAIASHYVTYQMPWTISDFFVGNDTITFEAIHPSTNETTSPVVIGQLYPTTSQVDFSLYNGSELTEYFTRYVVDFNLTNTANPSDTFAGTASYVNSTGFSSWNATGLTVDAEYDVEVVVTYTTLKSGSTAVNLIIEAS